MPSSQPPRIPDPRWLTTGPLARLLAVLDRAGEEARVVGGAVRNVLMGEPPGDIDIATTATPDEIIRRVEAHGFKAVPTGIEHGTVTVVVDGVPFEVTTLREDVETIDGRRAVVRFGRDWEADAERRDFTMNALSVAADGTIHDYVGGLPDLKARRVRFIGDPATRLAEDYLRILRFFRFHAAYGHGPPDRAGLAATVAARDGLDRLSRERVRMELTKLLVATGAAPIVVVMADTGLLGRVLGGVPLTAGFANMVAAEAVVGLPADPVRRLAALGVLIMEDAERLSERLRLSKAEHDRLAAIADGWWRIGPSIGEAAARAALYRAGAARFTDRVLIAWSRSGAEAADGAWRDLAHLGETWAVPRFRLKAADLTARGVPKGPRLGAALRAAEDAWIAAGFPADGAALAAIADAAAREAG
jgi:poly(A) polymerase